MTAYLDNSATTKPSQAVRDAVLGWMENGWYNPSALYRPALEAEKEMEAVRLLCLDAAEANGQQIVFTSGGTEADNLAILGCLRTVRKPGKVLLSAVEHPAVLACREEIERRGFETELIPVRKDGRTDPDRLEKLLTTETRLIAVMQVNNETGAIQPLAEIASLRNRICPEAAIHVDGVQGFLRVPIHFRETGIQSYALSGHKIHALKGTGALIFGKSHKLQAQLFGGGQEGGLRSGTENTVGILSLGAAIRSYPADANTRMRKLKCRLWKQISESIPEAVLNGTDPSDERLSAPHILSVSLVPVRSQTMLFALEGDGIYVSAGSACASRKQKISPVLKAMNLTAAEADSTIRFSLSPMTSEAEIDYAAERIALHYRKLRQYTRR